MRLQLSLTLSAFFAALSSQPASASTNTLEFAGTVLRTCSLTVGTPGVLDGGTSGILSSKGALGVPATATVVSTGSNFHIGVSNPSNFTVAPLGFNGPVDFETRYTMTGGTTVLNVSSGSQTLLNIGTSTLTVDLTATRNAGFPAGPYVAQTTVTCE